MRPFPGLRSLRGALLAIAVAAPTLPPAMAADRPQAKPAASPTCTAANTVTAKVVALEQVYFYNRYGSFNPAGMLYALRRDVVEADDAAAGAPKPIPRDPDAAADRRLAGKVMLRSDKRPRPLVLRANEGDCLRVSFTNLLNPVADGEEIVPDPRALSPDRPGEHPQFDRRAERTVPIDSEQPATRNASMHVNGLEFVGTMTADGSAVGDNPPAFAAPGETREYMWYAKKEGGYLLHSMAAPMGGEGDGGQLGLGLFGSVNVEPRGSVWYRSQTTEAQMKAATKRLNPLGTPEIDYGRASGGAPVLRMLDDRREIVHSDLNAVVDPRNAEDCSHVTGPGDTCGRPFREFTTLFHDELTAQQAFPEMKDETDPISSLDDGMAINYGASGLGAMVLANRRRIGPAADCVECKLEEFFLSSWAVGDPALVVRKDLSGHATAAAYPDDPSNVHHSYLGDPVRFRNLHAGPKETHVFHLHAHQWVADSADPNSVYLDSQTISPGASFTYEIHYGGSGNRNFTVGDSIFHCHLYPHFARGMWELWRTHDVFEDGSKARNLPDGEIAEGTANPAVVPLPHAPLPPKPTAEMPGYPFYVAAKAGHRPPQPPLDMERDEATGVLSDGGLPRHLVLGGTRETAKPAVDARYLDPDLPPDDPQRVSSRIAGRVAAENADGRLFSFAAKLQEAHIQLVPDAGTAAEQAAMRFHAGQAASFSGRPIAPLDATTRFKWQARAYPSCDANGVCENRPFLVNGRAPQSGAPYADPCPDGYESPFGSVHPVRTRQYRAAYVQFDMPVNKAGWHDPQARIITLEEDVAATLDRSRPAEPLFFRANSGECVVFHATNLMPSNLNLDDFQVFSPTDTIGQHIHLVKFDVTSSDGSANGWNYEDATFSAEEVRERIAANNRHQQAIGGGQMLRPATHRLFRLDGALAGNARGLCPDSPQPEEWAKHPWCGAQSTIQRWWADPLLNGRGPDARDRTIRTVFTHDHLGPSSHQQHGLYAALVIEPSLSRWDTLAGQAFGGAHADGSLIRRRADGGPTSYAANIMLPGAAAGAEQGRREFNLAFADFALMYTRAPENAPVNPPNRIEGRLPVTVLHDSKPKPEGISAGDPGGQLLNYRNEPLPLRIGRLNPVSGFWEQRRRDAAPSCAALVTQACADEGAACVARRCDAGDMANAFSSSTHSGQEIADAGLPTGLRFSPAAEPAGARRPGDPATPLLTAYEGDRVQIRLIQGAQEENHIFTMHNVKWLSEPESPQSGYVNAQPIGISEHFEFDVRPSNPAHQASTDYWYGSSATDNIWDGQWGLLRAFTSDTPLPGLKPLGGEVGPQAPVAPGLSACPAPGTPAFRGVRRFGVTAVLARDVLLRGRDGQPIPEERRGLVYNERTGQRDPNAILFVLTRENDAETGTLDRLRSGTKAPEPLILRARAGECLEVSLTNTLPDSIGDGPDAPRSWSFTMVPPLTPGLNFNQVAMSTRVSLHPQLVALAPNRDDGANVGANPDSTVPPGTTSQFVWYAGDLSYDRQGHPAHFPIEFGAIGLRDMADALKHASHGAVGALVVEPEGSSWQTDCAILGGASGAPPRDCLDAAATVTLADGRTRFREFVVIYQDDVSMHWQGEPMPNLRNGDDAEDSGQKAFNYRQDSLLLRVGAAPDAVPEETNQYDYSNVFRTLPGCRNGASGPPCPFGEDPYRGQPATPLFTAELGLPVRFRVVEPMGHPRNHGFTVFGHDWIPHPWGPDAEGHASAVQRGDNPDSTHRVGSASGVGPARHLNLLIDRAGGGVRGPDGTVGVAGDYLYRTQEGFMFGGGLWGILRVLPHAACAQRVDTSGRMVCQ